MATGLLALSTAREYRRNEMIVMSGSGCDLNHMKEMARGEFEKAIDTLLAAYGNAPCKYDSRTDGDVTRCTLVVHHTGIAEGERPITFGDGVKSSYIINIYPQKTVLSGWGNNFLQLS